MLAAAALAILLDGPAPQAQAATPAANAPAADAPAPARTPEQAILDSLVPRPLDAEGIAAVMAAVAVPAAEREAADAIADQYRRTVEDPHAKAVREVSRRIAASTRPGAPGTAPSAMDGPERIAMLEAAAAWRDALAAADREFLRRMLALRSADAQRCNGLVALARAEARDGLPSADPSVALRVADLVDAAKLEPADRRRVEDALDRQWTAVAEATERRRRLAAGAELERARLVASWGPQWRAGAEDSAVAERLARLDSLDARAAAADAPLRDANRAAVAALLRVLSPAAADRVREAADRLVWPWLFASERRLADAAARAGDAGGPDLAGAMSAFVRELDARLASSRRELGRRMLATEQALAAEESAPGRDTAVARLEAEARLLEARAKRAKAVVEAAARMLQAAAVNERAKPIMEEALASLQAEQRTLAWELDGTIARLAELDAPAPAPEGQDPTAPRP